MQSTILYATHGWLNDSGNYTTSRYMFKFDQTDEHWEFQIMVEIEGEWTGVDLPIMPRTLHVHHMHIYSNVVDNVIEIEFSDHQYQYTITVKRHLLTIEKFNRGALTNQIWYIANLVNAHIDIG